MAEDKFNSFSFGEFSSYLCEGNSDNSAGYSRLVEKLSVAMGEDLTDRQREIMTLYYIDGHNMVEIARMKGINVSSVSRTLSRARRRLYSSLRFCADDLLRR
ncbi:MAG: sigma-70 family RNA polymerase sigma factor [Oscillospiraceae bacterium]|nr:sigma-70 family RNA polymerase sigma factor [Oscillospiraceae bacterium]